jgi:hypothetical protein
MRCLLSIQYLKFGPILYLQFENENSFVVDLAELLTRPGAAAAELKESDYPPAVSDSESDCQDAEETVAVAGTPRQVESAASVACISSNDGHLAMLENLPRRHHMPSYTSTSKDGKCPEFPSIGAKPMVG